MNGFKTYSVEMTGVTPVIFHNDNLSWSEQIKKWCDDPNNKKFSVAGDDRTPAWRWIGYSYFDKGVMCVPADNLMTLLREGGAKCPTGKKGATYKRQTQSGLVVNEVAWPLIGPKGTVLQSDVETLVGNNDFPDHEKFADDHGFFLFVKRAKIGTAKHVRVRPRFDSWSASGTITVLDETITKDVLTNILTQAGIYCGLGDWRPSSPKSPGAFGKFSVKVTG